MLKVTGPLWRRQIEAEMLMSCLKHLAANLSQLHKLNHAATLGQTMPRQMSSIQGKQTCLTLHSDLVSSHHSSCLVCRHV